MKVTSLQNKPSHWSGETLHHFFFTKQLHFSNILGMSAVNQSPEVMRNLLKWDEGQESYDQNTPKGVFYSAEAPIQSHFPLVIFFSHQSTLLLSY